MTTNDAYAATRIIYGVRIHEENTLDTDRSFSLSDIIAFDTVASTAYDLLCS